jgi:hypothetical protein
MGAVYEWECRYPEIPVMSRILHWANANPLRDPRSKALYSHPNRLKMDRCLVRGLHHHPHRRHMRILPATRCLGKSFALSTILIDTRMPFEKA